MARQMIDLKTDDEKVATRRRRQARKIEVAFERAVEDVTAGQTPSLDGLADIGTREVLDPYELQEVADGKRAPEKLKPRAKLTNLRDDPIGQMGKRKQIDDLQYEAARMWQALYDAAQIGGARGMDPTRDVVDGGKMGEPVSDVQRAAIKRLGQIDRRLGHEGSVLVRRVLGERMSIAKVTSLMGDPSDREQRYVGRRLRECLDTAIEAMRLIVRGIPVLHEDDRYTAQAARLTAEDFRRGREVLRQRQAEERAARKARRKRK